MRPMILTLALLLCSQSRCQQAVPIQNPSFESPVSLFNSSSQCGSALQSYGIPNWAPSTRSGAGVIQWTCEPLPDGRQVAYVWTTYISQDLGAPPQAGTYALTFYVANWFYFYPGQYKAALLIGQQELCSTTGYAIGDFTAITLTCPVSGHIATDHGFGFGSGNLNIEFASLEKAPNGDNLWPLLFDDVSLTFAPLD